MNYRIEGRNLEMIRVELHDSHDTIIAQVGRMIYKSPSVSWQMTVPVQGLVGKLTGSLKRRMSGETAIQCLFSGPGEVGFGGTVSGTIQAVEIAAGRPSLHSAAASSPPRLLSATGSPPRVRALASSVVRTSCYRSSLVPALCFFMLPVIASSLTYAQKRKFPPSLAR